MRRIEGDRARRRRVKTVRWTVLRESVADTLNYAHAYIWIASPVIVHKYFDICKKILDKQHKICYHIIGKTLAMIDQGFNMGFTPYHKGNTLRKRRRIH